MSQHDEYSETSNVGLMDWLRDRLSGELERSAREAEESATELMRIQKRQEQIQRRLEALRVEADVIARRNR